MVRVRLFSVLILGAVLTGTTAAQTVPPRNKNPSDLEMVERLMSVRKEYQQTLENLLRFYTDTGDTVRARWAEYELIRYHRLRKYAFRLDLDLPPPTIKGDVNIPEANKLYRLGMGYKDKGQGLDYIDNQRRAEMLFQKILEDYPRSNKISDTAYQLGDLYESKAFKQPARAAAYFERCYQWSPNTQFDARMRAAHLYDYKLNDRARAVQIYREILTHETNESLIEEAKHRLLELSTKQ